MGSKAVDSAKAEEVIKVKARNAVQSSRVIDVGLIIGAFVLVCRELALKNVEKNPNRATCKSEGVFMQAKMLQLGDVTVVTLQGRLEIERANYLKKVCLDNLKNKKVVFCLEGLSFVGSSGIQNFFGFLDEVNKNKMMNVRLAGLKPDFMRLWSFSDRNVELHGSLDEAMKSFI